MSTQNERPMSPVLILAFKYHDVKRRRAIEWIDFRYSQHMLTLFYLNMQVTKTWRDNFASDPCFSEITGKVYVPKLEAMKDECIKEAERTSELATDIGKVLNWSAEHVLAFAMFHYHYSQFHIFPDNDLTARGRNHHSRSFNDFNFTFYCIRWLRSLYENYPEIQSEELFEGLENWSISCRSKDFQDIFEKVFEKISGYPSHCKDEIAKSLRHALAKLDVDVASFYRDLPTDHWQFDTELIRCTAFLWVQYGDIEYLHKLLCGGLDDESGGLTGPMLVEIAEKYIWGGVSDKDIKERLRCSFLALSRMMAERHRRAAELEQLREAGFI